VAESRRDIAFKKYEQIEIETKTRRKVEEKLRRRRRTPMTKAQFKYRVMRDLGRLEEYYDDFE
jgi:hypothetical protein